MNFKNIFCILTVIMAGGCSSHSVMRGTVAMKINEREAHVCMNDDEVRVGDKLKAYSNNCIKGPDDQRICEKKEIGEAYVTQILNSHYSVVKFSENTHFDEGTFVEKRL